jgi:hypothetical protein
MFFELVTGEGPKKSIDETLQQSRKTGKCNLSGRELKTIPKSLWCLSTLPVKEGEWWNLSRLEEIDLSDNKLTDEGIALPPGVEDEGFLFSLLLIPPSLLPLSSFPPLPFPPPSPLSPLNFPLLSSFFIRRYRRIDRGSPNSETGPQQIQANPASILQTLERTFFSLSQP